MGGAKEGAVIRRSVAIPRALAAELEALIPAAERPSFNGLVLTALKAYLKAERRRAFIADLERMAADPDVQREFRAIDLEFRCTEMDGLGDD